MWVSLSARNAIAKYSAQGAPLGEYPLTSPNSLPAGLRRGPGYQRLGSPNQRGQSRRPVRAGAGCDKRAIDHPGDRGERGTTVVSSEGTDYGPGELHSTSGKHARTVPMRTHARISPGPHQRRTWPRRRTPTSTFGSASKRSTGVDRKPVVLLARRSGNNTSARTHPSHWRADRHHRRGRDVDLEVREAYAGWCEVRLQ